MKIAITGKGGVGKTTLSAVLARLYAKENRKVIAVDADPDANLSQALGLKEENIASIKPLAEMADLIEERTGAKPGSSGGIFKLNPKVDDIPESIGYKFDGITILMMGKPKGANSGCYCPENVLLKRLLKHLFTERKDVIIVDMEAGIEHMTRGTAEGVDAFIVVVEPGKRSIQTAFAVKDMAKGMGVDKVFVVINKARSELDIEFVKGELKDLDVLGVIGYHQSIVDADMAGNSPFLVSTEAVYEITKIKERLDALNVL
ncbi:MAG TPA: AAA family ATPase [Nitrospirae bacterium]|nr:AAA family ATPase [Nitrospirota bacterium]